jgi:hypothetical protein
MAIWPLPWMRRGQVACNCAEPWGVGAAWVGGGGAGCKPLVVVMSRRVVGVV